MKGIFKSAAEYSAYSSVISLILSIFIFLIVMITKNNYSLLVVLFGFIHVF